MEKVCPQAQSSETRKRKICLMSGRGRNNDIRKVGRQNVGQLHVICTSSDPSIIIIESKVNVSCGACSGSVRLPTDKDDHETS